jgi:hypothetical protein
LPRSGSASTAANYLRRFGLATTERCNAMPDAFNLNDPILRIKVLEDEIDEEENRVAIACDNDSNPGNDDYSDESS